MVGTRSGVGVLAALVALSLALGGTYLALLSAYATQRNGSVVLRSSDVVPRACVIEAVQRLCTENALTCSLHGTYVGVSRGDDRDLECSIDLADQEVEISLIWYFDDSDSAALPGDIGAALDDWASGIRECAPHATWTTRCEGALSIAACTAR